LFGCVFLLFRPLLQVRKLKIPGAGYKFDCRSQALIVPPYTSCNLIRAIITVRDAEFQLHELRRGEHSQRKLNKNMIISAGFCRLQCGADPNGAMESLCQIVTVYWTNLIDHWGESSRDIENSSDDTKITMLGRSIHGALPIA